MIFSEFFGYPEFVRFTDEVIDMLSTKLELCTVGINRLTANLN